MPKPRIAVMLDENTSDGGKKYQLSKDCFDAIVTAGGVPYGIPYVEDMASCVGREFDGFISAAGSAAFPSEWYEEGVTPSYPSSKRVPIEHKIIQSFLDVDKPVLGICHGMQMLAGMHGCKIGKSYIDQHVDGKKHKAIISDKTKLLDIIGQCEVVVDSWHRDSVNKPSPDVFVGATAPDGTIEAIEIKDKKFALGIQWHQEHFWQEDHAGNKIFKAFVESAF